eukprot:4621481-Amphidinium_carterae.1
MCDRSSNNPKQNQPHKQSGTVVWDKCFTKNYEAGKEIVFRGQVLRYSIHEGAVSKKPLSAPAQAGNARRGKQRVQGNMQANSSRYLGWYEDSHLGACNVFDRVSL